MNEDSQNTVMETTDNSQGENLSLDEQIDIALEEPESPTEETVEQTGDDTTDNSNISTESTKESKDNSIDCPEKFKNEDGTINVKNLAKSYKELEPLLSKNKALEDERAELLKYKERLEAIEKQNEDSAKQAGYDSASDMQQAYDIAQFEANEYLKYLRYLDADDMARVQGLIYEYAQNPSSDLMEEIEIEFAPEINKRIAIQADRMQQQYEYNKMAQAESAKMSNIQDIISKSVDSNIEIFKYEPFKNMFINALKRFGDKFTYEDAESLIGSVVALKGLFEEEFKKSSASNKENEEATNKLAAISGTNSAPASNQIDDLKFSELTDAQLDKVLDKYI